MAMADTEERFEVAAAEERERSAEEQERERCVAGERAMQLEVKTKEPPVPSATSASTKRRAFIVDSR